MALRQLVEAAFFLHFFINLLFPSFNNPKLIEKIDKDVVFSIIIPNDDYNNLKQFLESNYGLTIEKKTEKRDMLVVY